MKRKVFSIILCLALVLALMTGCGEANGTANNATNNEENNNTPTDNNEDKDDDNDGDADDNGEGDDEDDSDAHYPFVFHLTYATEEALAPYANYAEVVVHDDDYSVKILVTVDETITDVKIYALEFTDFDTENNEPIYNKTLVGQFDSITPEMPLVIQQTYAEFMATCGFSYVDANGGEHTIGITESGLNGNPIPGNIQ